MTSALLARLERDLSEARRARDKDRTLLLGTTLSEARNRGIELGRDPTDEEVEGVIGAAVKRRLEAAEQMRAGGRAELAEREEAEAEVLRTYLPEPLREEAVRAMIAEAVASGAADIGAIMRAIMPGIRGRFDGRDANRLAREALDGG